MDALLATFLACLLCESGGALEALAIGLSRRFARITPIILGLFFAAAANAAIAAWGGAFLAEKMAPDARSLFLAISLVLAGVGLFLPVKQPDLLDRWAIGALPTAFFGMAILMFGNSAQFLVMGVTVRTMDPLWAAIGGTLGVVIACIPAIVLQARPVPSVAMRWLRRIGGGLLLLIGAVVGLSAVRLM